MTEQQYAEWAADLRAKYGIADPVAGDAADDIISEIVERELGGSRLVLAINATEAQ